MALSFEQIRQLVRQALESAVNHGPDKHVYLVELYPDSVIYEMEGSAGKKDGLYQRSYSLGDDGQVILGVAAPVQRQVDYIPMQAAIRIMAAAGQPADDEFGYVWRVQVNQYGLGKDGRINWPREPLVAALPMMEGARVFALNESQHQAGNKTFGKSVREIVGWLRNTTDTGKAIEADLVILKSAKWLRDGLVDSHKQGKPDLFGLSLDVTGTAATKTINGKKVREPVKITHVEVDVVYEPTNNGKFIRMAAAEAGARKDQVMEQETGAQAGTDMQKMQKMMCTTLLQTELAGSKLPAAIQDKLKVQFGGKLFEVDDLQAAIRLEKETLDKMTGSGGVVGSGDVRIVRESSEKFQAAVDMLFGVQVQDKFADITPFKSLRAAYAEMTGDAEVRGFLDPDQTQRMQAAYGSATFSYILGNSLYRRLVMDYKEIPDYGVSRLVGPNIRNAKDFKTLESVRIGYYGDLPDVDPETEDYPDLAEVGDERIDYALNQKGGIITVTRKMILNDDVRALQRVISRLPRAARRTLAKRCWGKFINNATYKGDDVAVFHDDHGNLGSTAYGITSALAAKTAFAQQTEPESGERLMLRPVTIAFPSELYGIVKNVNDFNPQAVSISEGNTMFKYFDPEGLIECPFMTDADDWMMFADPAEVEILELAYLNGQQEPEMFVADNPAIGQMFVADKMQYKIRHEYECEIADYRGAYKAVVAS
ncbi:MAG: hypothetical protein JXK94_02100 [Deltaproteobacteria bacterium]|nr:hypothetical protein [Deltaproteobacteria bacterium]